MIERGGKFKKKICFTAISSEENNILHILTLYPKILRVEVMR